MKKSTLLATALISGVIAVSTIANAGPAKGGHGKYSQMTEEQRTERMEKRLNRIAQKLGLSDEQKTQFSVLKQTSRNEMKPLRNEQRSIRQEIRSLDINAIDYQARLADAANRQGELKNQMIIARGNQRKLMASILTTDQLAKLKEIRSKRKGKHHKRKHRKQINS